VLKIEPLGSEVAVTGDWLSKSRPAGTDDSAADAALAELAHLEANGAGPSLATLVVHRGAITDEQYGPTAGRTTKLISWSMAKSITQAALGICVERGLLGLQQPAPVGAWQDDDRRHITIEHLVQMRSGLKWSEVYTDADGSDVIEMLFGSGAADTAAYTASLPLKHAPGSHWEYSSGTTNVLARIIGDVVGGTQTAMHDFLQDNIFGPIGMTAEPKFDNRGTFLGSSFVYATARDFARFGELYRLGGRWGGQQVVPSAWVARASTDVPVEVGADESFGYADHWWTWDRAGFPGAFAAHGFEGQRIIVFPDRELVVVQLSKNPDELRPALERPLRRLIEAYPITA
jgi:CubicO group peptidase (beta-lactamase class C family)